MIHIPCYYDRDGFRTLECLAGSCECKRPASPETVLARLAARLNCEPRQVFDRVVRMLEENREENQNHRS